MAVCPTCGGINPTNCPECHGTGVVQDTVITTATTRFGAAPSAPPPPPPQIPSRPLPPRPAPKRRGALVGGAALLALCLLALLALARRGGAPAHTVTIYIQGTPVQVTVTPGPSATPIVQTTVITQPTHPPIVVYVKGTPTIVTPTPAPTTPPTPAPTLAPTATPHPILALHDAMDGVGPTFAISGDLNVNAIGPDATTINRGHWWQDWITWQAPNIVGFDLRAYYCTGLGDPTNCDPNHPNLSIDPLLLEESADNAAWCAPGYTQIDQTPDPTHPDWTPVDYRLAANCVTGARYLRVTWVNTDATIPVWNPALGDLVIQYQP